MNLIDEICVTTFRYMYTRTTVYYANGRGCYVLVGEAGRRVIEDAGHAGNLMHAAVPLVNNN